MTVINILTVVSCIVIGALMVRYGNFTLHRQQQANREKGAKKIWLERERVLSNALDALSDLAEKRRLGILEISDESWSELVEMQQVNPRYLIDLLLYIDVHTYRARSHEEVTPIRVVSEKEVFVAKTNRRRGPDWEPTPRGGLMIQPSTA